MTTVGSTPHERHNAASATSNANSAGCRFSVRSSAARSPWNIKSVSGTGRSDASAPALVDHSAKLRLAVVQRAAHAGVLGSLAGEQERHFGQGRCCARTTLRRSAMAARSRAISAARLDARMQRGDRSAHGQGPPCKQRQRGSGPDCSQSSAYHSAKSATAESLRAASGSRFGTSPQRRCGRRGASSRMMCAFVPLNPNELTPARRARGGPGVIAAGMATARPSKALAGSARAGADSAGACAP